jgi:fructose-bisphosphate aldolase / 2-amino-3,7-dideoxy-D-threo-hept-6-ulosonate synthase
MNPTMNIGKTRRLTKILQPDGHTVIVPMDHGVSVGPIQGIEDMQATVSRLNEGAVDAVVLHKGLAKRVDVGKAGLIVHLSAISNLTPNCQRKVQVCSVLEALRLGADAVSVHVNVGAEHEHKMLEVLGRVADECDLYGVPLLAMMYPRGPTIKNEHDVEVVAHAARLGAELGADIIKTNYTGTVESFRKVIEGCPVPVIIAGGPKAKTAEDVLQTTYESMQAGAAGLSIGRNVFQHENPAAIVKALCAIVHQSATVATAKKLLGEA